jgi:predicted RNA-binding protein
MRATKEIFIFTLIYLFFVGLSEGQTTIQPKTESLVGNISKIDIEKGEISIKNQEGEEKTLKIIKSTSFLRLDSEGMPLENAQRISLNELILGNRLFVRGIKSAEKNYFLLQTVIVLQNLPSQGASQIQGRVTSIDISKKEIKITGSLQTENRIIVIDASSESVDFRRYGYKSLKFDDSVKGTFEQIKIGDNLKSLGTFDDKISTFKPKVLISGTFKVLAGKIKLLDFQSNEVTIIETQTNQTFKLKIVEDVRLKKLSKDTESEVIKMYFKDSSSEKPNFTKNYYDNLPNLPINELVVDENVLLSTVVDEKNTPVSVSSFLIGVNEIFKILSERQKKSRQPLNLGSISL